MDMDMDMYDGAILKLYVMPRKCNECLFADKEVKHCAVKGTIIDGKHRTSRMPLCPLVHEKEYLDEYEEYKRKV